MSKITAIFKKHQTIVYLILIIMSAGLVYSDCLKTGLTNWDDGEQVVNNRDIRELSLAQTTKIFKSFYLGMYQPLVTSVFALEYHFVKDAPWLYHLDNLLLHFLNIILVWLLTKQIFKKKWLALLSSAIFAIHPMGLEAVIWVSARSTLMFTSFYLLSLIFYLKYLEQSKLKYYGLMALFFILAIFSKVLAITLPLILLSIDYYRNRPLSKKLFLEKIPLLALSVVFGLVATKARNVYGGVNQSTYEYSLINKVVVWLYSVGDYLEKLILPNRLSAYYAFPEQINGHLPWDIYLVVAGFLIICFLLMKFRKYKILVFLGLFYLINLAPTVQIKMFSNTVIADRYTYLAGLSVIWLIAFTCEKIIATKPRYKKIAVIFMICYLVMLGLITANRTEVWQNNFIFWQRAVDQYPYDSFALSALGGAYYEFKYYDKTLEYLERAIKINSRNSDAFSKLGSLYAEKRKYEQAIEYYNKAVAINPSKSIYYYNRACAIAAIGDQAGALVDYEWAIKTSKPTDEFLDNYYLAMANTKYKLKDFAGAILAYDTAIPLVENTGEAYFFRSLSKLNLKKHIEGCQDLAQADKLGYGDAKEAYTKFCK
jgi:tetratricopeptide (TPR) repeat protein